MRRIGRYRVWGPGALLALVGGAGCDAGEVTGEFDPVYYAVVYGTVEQGGEPFTGAEVQAEVYLSACPPSGTPTSSTATRSGAGGRYRLLLASADSAAGQCLRLGVAGVSPVLHTLESTAFGATTPAEVADSVSIDLILP